MPLRTDPSEIVGDALFAALAGAHEGFDEHAALVFNTQLVLILANHIGSSDVFEEALRLAASATDARCDAEASLPSGSPGVRYPSSAASTPPHRRAE